ncbi:MAG: DUF1800 domain-containing protein [Phycisphaerae bacterium]
MKKSTQSALPSEPFAAWSPTKAEPFGRKWAGHLLRRLCLGATEAELDAAEQAGPAKTLDALFDFDPADDALKQQADSLVGFINFGDTRQVQEWWVHRMLFGKPLQERMALFWHNHFATSHTKVGGERMHLQIRLFRRLGMGSFRELLIEIGKDPAMLVWLDGHGSHKNAPNENYAREVMELFSLGTGSYTEDDVKELSRCFTGWRAGRDESYFDKNRFDDGEKHVHGMRGAFDAETVVDVLLAQPAAPRFIAAKLLREFVHPEPPAEAVTHYAARLKHHNWHIGPVLREMVSSNLFYSAFAYRSRIKMPAELVLGSVKALGGRVQARFCREQLEKMGQDLLNPPDVSGWDGGEAWINANTVLVRFNFGLEVSRQRGNYYVKGERLHQLIRDAKLKTAEDVVDHYAALLLDGEIRPDARSKLVDYMNRNEKNEPAPFKPDGNGINNKVRGVIHLMTALPDYQLA